MYFFIYICFPFEIKQKSTVDLFWFVEQIYIYNLILSLTSEQWQ